MEQELNWLCPKSRHTCSSLCNLCVLCASVVNDCLGKTTTETQRTQRLHREIRLFGQSQLNSDTTFPTATIYTPTNVLLGSFLGGPFVAGYLIARNFSAFGESQKAWLTWIITIVVAAMIFCIAFALSETNSRAIPAGYSVIAYTLVRHYQGDRIDAHLNAGGAKHGWLNVIGISIVGLILTLVLVVIIAVVVGVDE